MYLYVNIIAQHPLKVKQTSGVQNLKNLLSEPVFSPMEFLLLLPYPSLRQEHARASLAGKSYLHFGEKPTIYIVKSRGFHPCILLLSYYFG